ncbi:lantibiotic dehydratase [Alkalimonas amylolytica]|uniref:Thiopeptide-type bacteriocin biosynthesis domain-containing protein n=1 Tax=Alkalimonas amylolytica TaxID=152573 RepID=A0A1H4EM06_ALKAM|nr:lantibiotic dehydratase [Alkalimonas amylolytica]SEA85262.1 thiopeptide-type bacteriocin biosynthesis domain-containing protein [Alkalimonas amylolytica]
MSSKTDCVTDFVVVRVPRLSLDKIRELPKSEAGLCDYLASWLASPGVLEAIYLASPSLVERLDLWRSKPDSKSGRKVTTALMKYLIRMSSRPTPFGLFSGVALGNLSDETQLKPASLQQDGRKTRLDMFYLSTIHQQWAQSDDGRKQLRYVPNSTLYRLGSYLHYIESYQSSEQRQYRLSSVELDEALEAMLRFGAGGKLETELVELFANDYPEAAPADIENYIQQLIKEQVLVAELKLPITSGQPDQAFVQQLLQANNPRDGELLQTVINRLATLDLQQSGQPEDYQAIVQQLKQLPYPVSENKLFQTDSWRAMSQSQLDQSLPASLEKTLLALKAQTSASDSPFEAFIKSFQQRFEGQFVPLLQLLDDEAGIPFSNDTGYETPLLAGINIANRQQRNAKSQPQNALEQHVLKAMQQQARAKCIQLSSDELLKHSNTTALWQQLPASFAANISCYLDNEGQPLLHFHGCSGPSGANLLGRFCHLSHELQQQVRDYLAAEEALSPEVVFAEVVHMPDGRPGNVIARPPLRQYEIVFLADTVLPEEQQIPVQDLYVFIEAGQVKLWSKRLHKQVIPRLTSAHNYSARSLGVYRFLCMLQHQQGRLPHFSTPSSFMQMDYQPRVQLDHVILQEAQWQVERSMLDALVVDHKWQPDAWDALEQRYQLPRYVCYAISDNVLTIDLHNPAMIMVLLGETTRQKHIQLKESLAMQYQSMVANEEGDFAHEILVPMLNEKARPFVTLHPNPVRQLEMSIQRRFAPGSQWLSLKVYAAQSTAELVLSETITPLLQKCQQQGLFQQWFFIRYGDPDWHLRLRLYGEPAVLYGQVLPLLHQQLAPWLESGRVHKTELFTYQREVERYGGDAAMALAEQVFQADSYFVLQSVSLLRQHGESVRWRMALLGVDTMLTAFGYDLAQKLELISGLRQGFGQEFKEHAQLRTQLGKKYRNYQAELQQDFQALDSGTDEQPRQQMLVIRQQFLLKLQPIASGILGLQQQALLNCTLDTLMHSLLHMFNNRMFKAYGREQEFVVYDFLRRFYLSCQSQQQKGSL